MAKGQNAAKRSSGCEASADKQGGMVQSVSATGVKGALRHCGSIPVASGFPFVLMFQPVRTGLVPFHVPMRRRTIMKLRKGAPLLMALAALLGAAQAASASHCGFF